MRSFFVRHVILLYQLHKSWYMLAWVFSSYQLVFYYCLQSYVIKSQQQLTQRMNVWQRADVCFGMRMCGNWASIERYCAEKELHSSVWTLGRARLLGVRPAVCNLPPLGVTEITRRHVVVSFVCFYKYEPTKPHLYNVGSFESKHRRHHEKWMHPVIMTNHKGLFVNSHFTELIKQVWCLKFSL